jgi:hypothetical protein
MKLLRQVLTAKKDATIKNSTLKRFMKSVVIKMRFISFQKIINTQKKYEMIWAGESEIIIAERHKS